MNQTAKPGITLSEAAHAMDTAVGIVRGNLERYAGKCQNHSSVRGVYPAVENNQWTSGFWPGEIWLAYEHTGDEVFRQAGFRQVDSFLYRIQNKIGVDFHDLGFLYTPSCVAAYKLTGCKAARTAALLAADQLLTRFREKGQFLQAWGPVDAPDNYRFIIDCLLNLPLLYWASEQTGNGKYRELALRHTATCLEHSIRPDGSTYHTFFMDLFTGAPLRGATNQGYKDDSYWARGQAWAIYGLALAYRYDPHPAYSKVFDRLLEFYMSRLPEDLVPYWDMVFTDGSGEPRDSSSASIVACGLLEMARYADEDRAGNLKLLARQMLHSLWHSYAVREQTPGCGLVLHGTYSKKSPYNECVEEGVDESVSWGDYFYMEALTRLLKDWDVYW